MNIDRESESLPGSRPLNAGKLRYLPLYSGSRFSAKAITDDDRRKIFGENLAGLLGIEPRRRIGAR